MISILLLALVFVALHGCASSSPETTVREFLEAATRGNEKRMVRWTVEGNLGTYRGGERFLSEWDARYRVIRISLEGNRSVAIVEFEVGEKRVEVPYVCRRKGGKWKISLVETMKTREEGV